MHLELCMLVEAVGGRDGRLMRENERELTAVSARPICACVLERLTRVCFFWKACKQVYGAYPEFATWQEGLKGVKGS